jgi:hypothetical protein
MNTLSARAIASIFLMGLLLFAAPGPAGADENKLIAVDANHVAIKGYDTVAYFTDGKPIKGSGEFEFVWSDARWRFASAAHRDMFAADPERYAPQYGGYCAGAMKTGGTSVANPVIWTIVDGKLYIFADPGPWRAEDIAAADAQWRAKTGQ